MKRFAASTREHYEAAKRCFSYDPVSGEFRYIAKICYKKKIGDIAGSNKDGYIELIYEGCRIRAHRLAWFFIYDEVPDCEIDHKDTIKNHNWIDNLRKSSRNGNMCNKNMQKNNTSGYKGVSWNKAANKWKAQIQFHKIVYSLGYFDCPVEAFECYKSAALKLHKDFANNGSKSERRV